MKVRTCDLGFGIHSTRETGGLVHVSGRVNGGTIDTLRPHCSAAVSEFGDAGETKRAAHWFSAIRVRSLNDPRQGSLLQPCYCTWIRCQPTHPSPAFLAGGRHPAQRLRAGDTVETKRAAHRFYGNQDAIAQRSHPGSLLQPCYCTWI